MKKPEKKRIVAYKSGIGEIVILPGDDIRMTDFVDDMGDFGRMTSRGDRPGYWWILNIVHPYDIDEVLAYILSYNDVEAKSEAIANSWW